MIIKILKFKNYRCFIDFNIELDENIITFIGKNGVGKSCIFDGILYALYGFAQSSSRGGKSLIPNSTKPGEVCELEMVFNLDGIDYKIVRKIRGKNFDVEAFLYRGDSPDKPIAERDSGVNKAIEKLLGMDYDTFKMSVFSAQKDLSVFTSLTPENRKVEIRKLLNLEVIKEAIKLAREDVKRYKTQIELWESQAVNIDDLTTSLKELKKNNENLIKEINANTTQHKKTREELKITKDEIEKLSKIRDQVIELQSQIKQNDARISQFKDQIIKDREQLKLLENKKDELTKLDGHKDKYQSLEKELQLQTENKTKYEKKKLLENEIRKHREEYSRISEANKAVEHELLQYKDITAEKLKLQKQKEEFENEQKLLTTQITTTNTNITNAKKELDEFKNKVAQLQNLGPESVCPECERQLGNHLDDLVTKYLAIIEESEKFIKKLEKQRDEQKQAILKSNEKKKQIESNEENYEKRFKRYTQLQTNMNDFKTRLTETTNKGTSIGKQIKEFGEFTFDLETYEKIKIQYESERKIYEQIIALETEVKNIPTIQKNLKDLDKKIEELTEMNKIKTQQEKKIKFDEDSYQKLKVLLSQTEEEVQKILQSLHKLELQKLDNDKDSQAVERDIKIQTELKSKIYTVKKKTTNLESLMVILEEFEANLLVKIRPMIEEKTSELLRITTRGKYSSLELDHDYKPYVHDLDKKYSLDRFSGGEQDLVNLCLRIAIAEIVAQRSGGKRISFLVLDEIFGSQDDERRLNIINTLQALIGNFRQIFIITHEDIKESMPIVYEISEIARGNSVIKLIN